MKKSRGRRINIAIETCFDSFYKELDRNLIKASEDKDFFDLRVEFIEEAGCKLRHQLFGMHLVANEFTWKEYLILREKVFRITKEYVTRVKSQELHLMVLGKELYK